MGTKKNEQRPLDGNPADDRPAWMKKDFSDDEGDDLDDGLEDMLGRGSDD